MTFTPIYNAFVTKPRAQYFSNPNGTNLAVIRDNFSLTTWLLIGASIQGLLCLLPYRNVAIVAPVVMLLAYRAIRVLLMTVGLLHNPYMDGVLDGRTVPVYPDEKGSYEKPADAQVCAIMLAVRSNHPLGIFADGFKEVGDYFAKMSKQLDGDPTVHGYLGNSSWLSAADRGVSSEFMSMVYFDTPESLHAFAHGPLHTEAMEWWQRTAQKHKHIGIMHEVYAAPKKSWEGVYINYHPTGLGATNKEVNLDGKKVWMNPLVQGKGKLTYSKGRMGHSYGDKEWMAFENTLTSEDRMEAGVKG